VNLDPVILLCQVQLEILLVALLGPKIQRFSSISTVPKYQLSYDASDCRSNCTEVLLGGWQTVLCGLMVVESATAKIDVGLPEGFRFVNAFDRMSPV